MAWKTALKKIDHAFYFYIGSVKVAEICFDKNATKWKVFLRLMYTPYAYDVEHKYQTMSEALKDLHRMLNTPIDGEEAGASVASTEEAVDA